jgi:hypothetical protein
LDAELLKNILKEKFDEEEGLSTSYKLSESRLPPD